MPHALVIALEICLGYVALSLLCTGALFGLIYRRERALEAERPPASSRSAARLMLPLQSPIQP
jgi:hypothetical protein